MAQRASADSQSVVLASDATMPATPGVGATNRSVTAGVASAQLMAANTARRRFIVKNDSAIVVYINLSATATTANGVGNIAVAANGGYFELAGYTGAVSIIAASGTPAITAYEF